MSMPSIGIIGAGFVGGALARGFAHYTSVKIYDIEEGKRTHTLGEVVLQDVLFVAVPTPMLKNGECDTSMLEGAIDDINSFLQLHSPGRPRPLLIRSTVPPDFIRNNIDKWDKLEVIFNPEFLTERTADLDFIQSSRFILGTCNGTPPCDPNVEALIEARFPRVRIVHMSWEDAALVKYGTNVFFTVKLSFFNELAKIVEDSGGNPQAVINELLQDGRIGRSHYQVPGHDGSPGWGGSCFYKDNRAFSRWASSSIMADAAWQANLRARTESRVAEELTKYVGRASSEEVTLEDLEEMA